MDILFKVLQVTLALSILVLVHEWGHFSFARLFRIRVDKFYLFFNPYFSLIRCKKVNGKWRIKLFAPNVPDRYQPVRDSFGKVLKDEKGKPVIKEVPLEEMEPDDWRREEDRTEYGFGWLPLGGYCRVTGMIDESMDSESMKKEPQPWEYRSKPAWQRFFVMIGGILFNLALAFLVYGAMLYVWGESYIKNADASYGVICTDLAKEMGFKDGDKVLAYDQTSLLDRDFGLLAIDLIRMRPQTVTVLRGTDTISFGFDQKFIPLLLKSRGIFDLNTPFVVGAISENSANIAAGILAGDRLTALNDAPVNTYTDAQQLLPQHANDSVMASFDRDGASVMIPLWIDSEGHIGVTLDPKMSTYFHITKKEYSLLSCVPAGINKTYHTVKSYISDLGLIFSPKTEAYKSVGSVIAIANIFPSTWDWRIFWNITALLSIMFAVLNLLPIPALDGGHVLFVLFEMVTGHKPGDKFLEYAQLVGMIILFAIMILAFGNDILRFVI